MIKLATSPCVLFYTYSVNHLNFLTIHACLVSVRQLNSKQQLDSKQLCLVHVHFYNKKAFIIIHNKPCVYVLFIGTKYIDIVVSLVLNMNEVFAAGC